MINVTAAIIERDGKILIAKRSSTSSLPNKWEFPGGKVEAGETTEECLARELWEEFNVEVTVGEFFTESI
jgi:8-oxo-dGTP diphosphatase